MILFGFDIKALLQAGFLDIRFTGLKILRSQGHVGSIPTSGTK
jgi:hypothetical protein